MVRAPSLRRFDVVLVDLGGTRGHEIRKQRPCVVVSPDVMNRHLPTLVVVPLTSRVRGFPWRVPTTFRDRAGEAALDQLRAVDRTRVARRLGTVDARTGVQMLLTMQELFAP